MGELTGKTNATNEPLPRYQTARKLAPEAKPEALAPQDRLRLAGGLDIHLIFGGHSFS